MNIYCIRHTKVDVPEGVCYGQTDVELAGSFDAEKKLILKNLEGIKFDRIYSSPLNRCRQLALSITPEVIFDDRLMEMNFGRWENQLWDSIFCSEEGKIWFNYYLGLTCPGGESFHNLKQRVISFIDDLKNSSDKQICIVTHSGPFKVLKALCDNQPIEETFNTFHPQFGEIIPFEYPSLLRPIMFVGTGSDVGKSVINAAFCRIFKQDGYSPAPFKAQNMSLNSYASAEGLELGRAQAVQAEACGIPCLSAMNPILLKPTSYENAQVVLHGKPLGNQSAREYFIHTDRDFLFSEAMKAWHSLNEQYNPIVMEGAGSISEINLRDKDITNMRVALETNAAVILVADIDRGGVFGSVYGTIQLLPEKERKLVKGILINKFRGDISLFDEGRKMLEELTGITVIGVVPYFHDIHIEQEDSVVIDSKRGSSNEGLFNVAVVLLKHMSNFTDFNVLEQIPGVNLFYTANPDEILKADIVLIPGSKNTIADLIHLREHGLAQAILQAHNNGKGVYGICGGYQMMGTEIHDPCQVEGSIEMMPGLGLLPVTTTLTKEKQTVQTEFYFSGSKELCRGYEIHMGKTELKAGQAFCILADGSSEGCLISPKLWGSYLHGIFDNQVVVEKILKANGFKNQGSTFDYKKFKEEQYNKLAAHVRQCVDMEYIYSVLKMNQS